MASIVRQKNNGDLEQALLKNTFLSYYISMYNSVNQGLGYKSRNITTDEIHDFIQDLKHEAGKSVPNVTKQDINFCFSILQVSGICKQLIQTDGL